MAAARYFGCRISAVRGRLAINGLEGPAHQFLRTELRQREANILSSLEKKESAAWPARGWSMPELTAAELARFVTLPHPIDSKFVRRGRETLKRKRGVLSEHSGPEELAVALSDLGANANQVARMDSTRGAGALDDFVRLHKERDQVILSYANRWGVLGICGHLMPYTHSRKCVPCGRSKPGKAGWELVESLATLFASLFRDSRWHRAALRKVTEIKHGKSRHG